MYKVDERVDLSKKVLEIDVNSPIFNCLLQDLNKEVQRCIKKVYEEEFEAGEITVKLSLEIPEAFKTIARVDEFGEIINDTYRYRQPRFEHKVTSTLKKQYKQEGLYQEERDVKFEDGKFVAVPIKEQQIRIDID